MRHSECSPEREVQSNTGLPKEDKKISNKQPKPIHKRTSGTIIAKPRASKRKEIIKIRGQLNDIETKENILKDQ